MQLVLPKCYRDQVLCQLHNNPISGHFAANKTLGRIRQRFYWVGYTRDIKLYYSNCELCASRKGPGHSLRGPQQSYNVGAPIERIAIEVLGPLPETEHGNKYLLIAMDYFSMWPEAYPLPNQEAITVAKVLVNDSSSVSGYHLSSTQTKGGILNPMSSRKFAGCFTSRRPVLLLCIHSLMVSW